MRVLLALAGVVMFAVAGVAAQQPAAAPQAPVTVRGAYTLHFQVSLASALPDGATVTCKARIAPQTARPGGEYDEGRDQAQPVTATGVGTVNGTLANCAVEIPFAWSVANARAGVRLSYQIVAVSVAGRETAGVRTGAREQLALAYPPEGGRTNLDVNLTF